MMQLLSRGCGPHLSTTRERVAGQNGFGSTQVRALRGDIGDQGEWRAKRDTAEYISPRKRLGRVASLAPSQHLLPPGGHLTLLHEAISDYHHAHRHQSPDTQRNHQQRLARFEEWCNEHQVDLDALTRTHLRDFLAYVATRPGMKSEQVTASTVKSYAQTVKAFLHWCIAENEYDVSPKVTTRVAVPTVEQSVIETFTPAQIADLFDACEKQPYPVRDKALLALLLDTGARASEVVGLTLECVFLDADDSHIKIMGKGRRERESATLGRTTRLALRRYITRYRKPATPKEQHVFLAGNTGKPLTRSGLHQIIAAIGQTARIKGVRCSPHTARHTMACLYLLGGGDLLKLCRLLGHQSIRTTERYLSAVTSRQARQGSQSVLDTLKHQL